MRDRIGAVLAGLVVAVTLASTATVFAGTYTTNGVTLVTPNYEDTPLQSCEPWENATSNRITVSGIPDGSTVMVNYAFSDALGGNMTFVGQTHENQSGSANYTIPYPQDTTTWPGQDGTSRSIYVFVGVIISTPDGVNIKVASKAWGVVCTPEPPPGDFQGCTPGYWRQAHHFDSWVGYAPADSFDTVFGVDSSLDPPGRPPVLASPTLLDAVWIGGGGQNAMARHAVAALLNSSSAGVNYPLSVGQVIAAVQTAYASGDFETAHTLFAGYNEIGCPLN